jgi:O-antigen ligase/tetratricopeptide (TPR) repeat protein
MKNKILLYIIKGAIIGSFFTPLYVSNKFIFPFVFPKTALFQILVEIMFFAWLILIFEKPEFRPSRSRIFWALSIFLFIIFLTSFLGVDFGLSFWSSYERMTGLVTMLHYFAFFLVLSSVLKTKKEWLLVFDAFIVANLALCFFGLFQKLGLEGFILAGKGRISATFGNPAYYAAYLLFSLFFIVFMFFQRQSKNWRIYYGASFVFTFIIFFWAQTRGALLAFGGSLILFLTALIFWPKQFEAGSALAIFRARLKKISMAILICFVIFVSLVYFFRGASWVKQSYTLLRLTTISFKETTTQTRLLAWRMSWQGFKERPVLGWGWENYNVVFNKYYDPNLYPVENWFDRAHNIVFDTLVTTGFLGFVSFFNIFGVVFLILWRSFKEKRIDFLNGVLFAILPIGYLVQDFFVFDMLFSYMPLFFFLAFISWIGKDVKKTEKDQPAKPIEPNIFLQLVIVAVFAFLFYSLNIRPALAGNYGIAAIASQQQGLEAVDSNFRKSLAYGTFGRFEVRLQLFEVAKNIMNNYQSYSDKKPVDEFVRLALEEGEKTLKERPTDARYALTVGELNMAATQLDPARLNRAEEVFELAYKLSPTKQIVLFGLGETKLRLGKTEEGLGYFKKAVELNDKPFDPHWNLAIMYFAIGDKVNGEKKLAEIEQRFGGEILVGKNYLRLGQILRSIGDNNSAILYLQKGLAVEPNNADLYASLADIYAASGEKTKAKEMAEKAVQLNPSLKDAVDQFIKSLE